MSTVMYVVAAIVAIALFVGFVWLLITLQAMACEKCPHSKECDKHQNEENYVPNCVRMRMENPNKFSDPTAL